MPKRKRQVGSADEARRITRSTVRLRTGGGDGDGGDHGGHRDGRDDNPQSQPRARGRGRRHGRRGERDARRAGGDADGSGLDSRDGGGDGDEPTSKSKSKSKSNQPNTTMKQTQPASHSLSPPPAPNAPHSDEDEDEDSHFAQVSRADVLRFRLDMGYGADVVYMPDFLTPTEATEWFSVLAALDTWYHPTLTLYGRAIRQSRAIAAYATRPMPMSYSGARIDVHHPFPLALERMRVRVERELGVRFNHVLLNRYEDGGVYIGRHSDTRDNGVIASISLGAERTFVMTPRMPAKRGGVVVPPGESGGLAARVGRRWVLANGSLVVMQGETQEYWKHEIPREPGAGARISLTFRQLV